MPLVIKDETWPPPAHWTQVFVSWDRMLDHSPHVHDLLDWVEKEYRGLGRYQLRGPREDPVSGFLFYFQEPKDATVFVLKFGL
jgi:hypothetical protein